MKKIVLCIIAAVMLIGCEKQDSLKGSVFAGYAYHANSNTIAGIHIDGYDAYYVYRFLDDINLERTTRKGGAHGEIIGEIEKGTYTYDYPNIEVTYTDKYSGREVVLAGEFLDKKTFRIDDTDYVKQ